MSDPRIKKIEAAQLKKNVPDVRSGETVKVHYRIREGGKERVQGIEGLVIAAKGGRSLQASFTVRKVASGVGVERTFPLHSPWIIKIERLKSGKVRRAKLYFVRQHAQSPKKFRLKDKGIAGTIWEEVAAEQKEIEQAESAQTASEPQISEEVAKPDESADNTSDEAAQESGANGGESGGSTPAEEESPPAGAQSTN